MDKYQQILINYGYWCLYMADGEDRSKSKECREGAEIVIRQYDDITVTRYTLLIADLFVKEVVCKKGELTESAPIEAEGKRAFFRVPIDFNDRIDGVILRFKYDMADELLMPIRFVEADREKYYAERERELRRIRIERAKIYHSTGKDNVNIYINPCDDSCTRVEITLYNTVGGKTDRSEWRVVKKYTENGVSESYFCNISGLADGHYAYVVAQYDESGALLFEDEPQKLLIK